MVRPRRGVCLQMTSQQKVRLTSSSEVPTYTVAGQQPHDAAAKGAQRLVSGPKAGNLTDSLSAPAWPQRKNSGHSPAFGIAHGTYEKLGNHNCPLSMIKSARKP